MSKPVKPMLHPRKAPDAKSMGPRFIARDAKTKGSPSRRISNPVLGYAYNGSRTKSDWRAAEYNLGEIQKIEDVESYVRRAFSKKIGLMYKEGWDICGKNTQVVDYIKLRLDQIAEATDVPTDLLVRDLGCGLVKKSNTFVVKVRDSKSSGGKVRKDATGKSLDPIAGYFIAPAETMEYQRNGNRLTAWRQLLPTGFSVEFSAAAVIHMFYEKKDGFVFGTPSIVPAIDDIRALRKIEENIEMLIYQHLFPLFQWVVGTKESPAGFTEAGEKEIDVVRREVEYMPSEGGIVTTERHEIKAIGAEGRALRAEGYLEHFKKRVFAGLGMSSVDFGEAATVNRSTSESLSQDLIDGVKDFQRVTELFVNEYIIKELLLESDFSFDILARENRAWFRFKEIDVDTQIRRENHYTDLFAKNVLTLDEARISAGREVIDIPSAEETDNGQDGMDKYPDWNKLFWTLIERPKALIVSVDEPFTSVAKAREAAKAAAEADRAAKVAPRPVAKDSTLANRYKLVKYEIVNYALNKQDVDVQFLTKLVETSMVDVLDELERKQLNAFRDGYSKLRGRKDEKFFKSVIGNRGKLKQRLYRYFDKLVKDTNVSIRRAVAQSEGLLVPEAIGGVFDTFLFRAEFIEDVEISKARNFGWVVALRDSGRKGKIRVNNSDCKKCGEFDGFEIDANKMGLVDVPPYHPHCGCRVHLSELPKPTDSIDNTEKHDKNIEDVSATLEECVSKVKRSLKKKYPEWSEKKITESASRICKRRMSNE